MSKLPRNAVNVKHHALKKIELPDNTNSGKMFSKHYLFCLDQGNFRSALSQILILQYPIPKFSLLDSRF